MQTMNAVQIRQPGGDFEVLQRPVEGCELSHALRRGIAEPLAQAVDPREIWAFPEFEPVMIA